MTEEKAAGLRPFWVFGYASLMWNAGFEAAERRLATLRGYRRSFSMRSIHHRGTAERPGLVLALDPHDGAECRGLALRVDENDCAAVLAYLRERELISSAYVERLIHLETDGGMLTALAYVVDTEHPQYVADLALEDQALIIARATGGRGANTEYLWNTAEHLKELGIEDADLEWLAKRVRELTEGN